MQSMPGKGNLQLTGKLGEVIRESAQLALSWVKSNAFALGITSSESDLFLQDRDIHLHVSQIELEASAGSRPVLIIVSGIRCQKAVLAKRDLARVPRYCPLLCHYSPRPRSTQTSVSSFFFERHCRFG